MSLRPAPVPCVGPTWLFLSTQSQSQPTPVIWTGHTSTSMFLDCHCPRKKNRSTIFDLLRINLVNQSFFFFFLGACEFGHVNFIVGKIWTVWNWANWKTEEKKTGIGRFKRRFKVLMIQSTGKCRKKSIYAKWFNVVTSIACAMVQTSPHVPHGMLLLAFRCATICDWVKDDQGWELF